MQLQLNISGEHYSSIRAHLYPGDQKEAVAVALCGRHKGKTKNQLFVHQVVLIPHEECYRERELIIWPTARIEHFFERVASHDLAILKIHSHPTGFREFSKTDDQSDTEFFDSVFGWSSSEHPHASAIMLPSGEIFGRFTYSDQSFHKIDKIMVAGDQILQFTKNESAKVEEFASRTAQAFGDRTYNLLRAMRVGIVGCSGTGSPVISQLTRLGVKQLVLVDPDIVEEKNLNRILFSERDDAKAKIAKVSALRRGVEAIGLETEVAEFQANIYDDMTCLSALIECDAIIGCMDSVDGRHLLNQMASFYLKPYFDLGVKLEADGFGGIAKICGTVHYLQPGKSSLFTRGVYTIDELRSASQLRKNPEEFNKLLKSAYIKNINVNSPAVISVNMQIASHAINEFLNRLHPFRSEELHNYAVSTIDLSENCICNVSEGYFEPDLFLIKKTGRGDSQPFLEMPELR